MQTATRRAIAIVPILAIGALLQPAFADAGPARPTINSVRCQSSQLHPCGEDRLVVEAGGKMRVLGSRFAKGMKVVFYGDASTSADDRKAVARIKSSRDLVVDVPLDAKPGKIRVRMPTGLRSLLFGPIDITEPPAPEPVDGEKALAGNGQWIWQIQYAGGGTAAGIAAQAKARNIQTVFIKSGDGTYMWSQFTRELVAGLKSRGIHVCGWQYVYGQSPEAEAAVSAEAARRGAECFIIDAEAEYEGRYSQAERYIARLRQLVGPDYPLGLSSFPYVNYHPSLPYSVFLRAGGAQYNLPQMYWRAIQTSVDNVYASTYGTNAVYGRTIYPVGQTWMNPPRDQILRFRELARQKGAPGVSWWSWQHTDASRWRYIGEPLPTSASVAAAPGGNGYVLRAGNRGDAVVQLQQHLVGAGLRVPIDGVLGQSTEQALERFQRARGLAPNGTTDAATWRALKRVRPARVAWSARATAAGVEAGERNGPRSAWTPSVRNELPPKPH